MKKVLNIIIVLLFSKLSFGQFANGVSQDNANFLRQFNGGVKALNALIPPTLDTGVANPGSTYYGALTASPLHPGKLFMSTQDGWVTIGSGGGSGLSFPSLPHKYVTGFDNLFGTLNTDSIIEATNLFWTVPRGRAAIGVLSPLVYNSTTGISSIDTTIIATKTDISTRWGISGNTGITTSNFIGTTDNNSMYFKVNNIWYGILNKDFSNISLGDSSLISNSGINNTAYGNFALKSNTSGIDNTAIGYIALGKNTTATFNSAFGAGALAANVTGSSNTALGGLALQANISSSFNTAIGLSSLQNSTGIRNTAIGYTSGYGITSGGNNTIIGESSFIASNGNYNTTLGQGAGRNSSGDSSVYIGASSGLNSTGSNKLYIANNQTTNLIAGDFLQGQVQINAASVPVFDASSAFEVRSTTKGFMMPRMTTTAKNAIVSPSQGLMVMDTTTHFPSVWNGTKWASRIVVANSLGSMQFPVGVGDTLRFVGDTTMSITFNSANNEVDFHSLGSGGGGGSNNFLSAVSFSGGTLTFARSGLSDLTQSIDGRYVKISDSAAMLSPYLRSVTATATYATITNLALKVNISDSSTAITGWTTKYQNSLNKLNTDSSNAITGYTTKYQNSLKLNKTDSTDMIIGYTTKYQNSLKQNLITLTTSAGASATFNQATGALNIPVGGGGGGGNTNTNSNVSGYRLAIVGGNVIKTVANKWGMILDSTTVPNPTGSISLMVDSFKVATTYRLQKSINDSLSVNTLYVSHALSTTDSLYQVFNGDSIKFKVPKAIFPVVLTTTDTALIYSMPNFSLTTGKTLIVDKSLWLTGTDGTKMTFPTTDAVIARTDAVAQIFLGDVNLSSTTATNNTIGRMRSGASNDVSNIVWQNSNGISNQTLPPSVPTGIPGISYRVNFAGAASTATDLYGYSNINIGKVQITSGGTGTQPYVTNLMVQSPAFSNGGARTHVLANEIINGKGLFTDADTVVSLMVKGTAMFTDSVWGSVVTLGTGMSVYNTTDHVTNYTRGRTFWNSGEYTIATEKGGTGLAANITLNSDAGINLTTPSGFGVQVTSPQIILNGNATSSTAGALTAIQATSTYTGSGTVSGLTIAPIYNQSASSAINTDLLISRTQTSLGSGAQKFMDAQISGSSKFSIANTGNVSTVGSYTFGTTTTPAPASGSSVLWFDGTNVKVTKNVSGTTTTTTIF